MRGRPITQSPVPLDTLRVQIAQTVAAVSAEDELTECKTKTRTAPGVPEAVSFEDLIEIISELDRLHINSRRETNLREKTSVGYSRTFNVHSRRDESPPLQKQKPRAGTDLAAIVG